MAAPKEPEASAGRPAAGSFVGPSGESSTPRRTQDDLEFLPPKRLAVEGPTNIESQTPAFEAPVPAPQNIVALQAEGSSPEPARSPKQLKSIRQILPYADYDPTPGLQDDPCANLCPRPDSPHCPKVAASPTIQCPEELDLGDEPYRGRQMPAMAFQWKASNLYHYPLYFEDVGLERYGHVHDSILQPFVSVGLFGVQLIGLPYQMTIDEVQRKVYVLGHYRPGDYVPKKYYVWPWSTEAALIQAGATVGMVYLLP